MSIQLKIVKDKNRRLVVILAVATLLTLWALIATPFTHELTWTSSEFLAAGTIFSGIGLSCEVVMREVKSTGWRIFIFVSFLVILFLAFPDLI